MRICVFVAAFAGSNNAVKSCVTDTASCESGIFRVPARGLAGQRHACKFADHACGSWLPWNAEGKGRRWLQIASITLAVAPLRSPAPRHSRAPRCERRPAIVYEMIMVVRYEVAGSRKAVRHLDWPVGSYKRREARADGRRDYAPRRRDAEPHGAPRLRRRRDAVSLSRERCDAVVGKLFEFMTTFSFSHYSCQRRIR